jgi:hypothetical protein
MVVELSWKRASADAEPDPAVGGDRAKGLETVAVESLSSDLRISPRRGSYESERGQPLIHRTSARAQLKGLMTKGHSAQYANRT